MGPSLRLGDDLVGDAQIHQVPGGELHDPGRLTRTAGVLPQDGGEALRREDGVDGVFQHEHPVGHSQSQGPAAAALTGDDGDHRHIQGTHEGQGGGDGLPLSPGLGLQAGVGAGGIHKGDDRPAELLGLAHEALGLPVAFGAGHTKVAGHILLKGLALPVSDDGDRVALIEGHPTQDGGVFPALPVPLELKKVGKQRGDVVRRAGPSGVAGQGHTLSRGDLSHGPHPVSHGVSAEGKGSPSSGSGGRSGPRSHAPPGTRSAGSPRAASAQWSAR